MVDVVIRNIFPYIISSFVERGPNPQNTCTKLFGRVSGSFRFRTPYVIPADAPSTTGSYRDDRLRRRQQTIYNSKRETKRHLKPVVVVWRVSSVSPRVFPEKFLNTISGEKYVKYHWNLMALNSVAKRRTWIFLREHCSASNRRGH